jgi:hypothetical protein
MWMPPAELSAELKSGLKSAMSARGLHIALCALYVYNSIVCADRPPRDMRIHFYVYTNNRPRLVSAARAFRAPSGNSVLKINCESESKQSFYALHVTLCGMCLPQVCTTWPAAAWRPPPISLSLHNICIFTRCSKINTDHIYTHFCHTLAAFAKSPFFRSVIIG